MKFSGFDDGGWQLEILGCQGLKNWPKNWPKKHPKTAAATAVGREEKEDRENEVLD